MVNEEIREGIEVNSFAEGLSQIGEPGWSIAYTNGNRRCEGMKFDMLRDL